MPCPHFSVRDNDCLLANELPKDEDEVVEPPREDHINRAWCTGNDNGRRNCPILRRFLADLLP